MIRGPRLSVLFATEGTYPFHKGGVSTWCHALTSQLHEVDFTLFAVSMHPYLERAYALPANVVEVMTVPLWGTEDTAEYGHYGSAGEFLRTRWSTTSEVVAGQFVPAYTHFLRAATSATPDTEATGDALTRMYVHFTRFDYQQTMETESVWRSFVAVVSEAWLRECAGQPPPALGEMADAWRLLTRLLTVLSKPIPRTDLTHSAAAAFCGLPCVIARRLWQTPYLLTEHGVYLREQYLNLARSVPSLFVRWFLLRIASAVTDINYASADQLSPVCQYNTRWERWRGADASRTHVIYNGVDPARFAPPAAPPARSSRPTVACVGLIFPLKGQLDLIEATALVRKSVPDVEVKLYGSTSDQAYFDRCEARVRELGLQGHVTFAGSTDKVWEVYQSADVVAMSSISEGFPYAVLEAMFSGAAVVATDVGGVSEALGASGVLVTPRDAEGMAEALVALLRSPAERQRLGAEARARALQHFTEERFVREHRASYRRLAQVEEPAPAGSETVTSIAGYRQRR